MNETVEDLLFEWWSDSEALRRRSNLYPFSSESYFQPGLATGLGV